MMPLSELQDAASSLAGNRLPGRWRGQNRFVILDAGFASGARFFTTWQAWRDDPARAQQLHYLAVLDVDSTFAALASQHAAASPHASLLEQLRGHWPPAVAGFQRLLLDDGKLVLTLLRADLSGCLRQLEARVDAFYGVALEHSLQPPLAKLLGRLAAPQATLAWPQASIAMQQALQQAGFAAQPQAVAPAWFCADFVPRWAQPATPAAPVRRAVVIGAGLAGSAACERLSARGWHVTLIERHAQPAQAASGNLAGIFMPLLSKDDNPGARLSRAAFLFAQHIWQRLGGIGPAQQLGGQRCGVLQLARDPAHALEQQAAAQHGRYPPDYAQWLDAAAVARRAGIDTLQSHGGWWFEQGGWVNPARVCQAMLDACGARLTVLYHASALSLRAQDGEWQVLGAGGQLLAQAPTLVLANGNDARAFAQAQHLPLSAVRGQVTHVPQSALPGLATVLCGDAYVTPPTQGWCSVGATYDDDADAQPRRASDDDNCRRLQQMLAQVSVDLDAVQNRVGFRCVAADRLPLVGALPHSEQTARLRPERLRDVARWPGLYGLLGYASRGLIWAPLAAELLAAQLEGEPLPLEKDLLQALDPARFMLKAARG